MATFCNRCGNAIGFFSKAKMVNEEGETIVVCKPCKRTAEAELIRQSEQGRPSGAPPAKDTVPCPRCGRENQKHYRFCLGCGADLSVVQPADPPTTDPSPEGALTLRVTGPEGAFQRSFAGSEVSIGRTPDNDLCLPSGSLSKRHARILTKGSEVILVDLKSSNGTYVNGTAIQGPRRVGPGDTVTVGPFTLEIL